MIKISLVVNLKKTGCRLNDEQESNELFKRFIPENQLFYSIIFFVIFNCM
jgi:hypothetical protein